VLVGALGVRFEHGARPGAVDRRRHAGLAVEPHVGVERRARDRDRFAEHRLAVPLQRRDEAGVAGQRLQRAGEQQPLDLDRDAGPARRGVLDHPAHPRLDLGRVLLGIIRRSSLSTTLPGTTLVLVPPWIVPTLRYGMGDARDAEVTLR
jgi:hypothetical protein